MDRNWSTQVSFAQKPDWWADSSLHFSRHSNKELKTILSNTSTQTGSKETGL